MVRIFLRHMVADYEIWRQHYDAFFIERRKMGVLTDTVFRNADDDHEITVTHDFDSLDEARRFVSPRQLREIKSVNGKESDPTFWYTVPARD